MLFILEGLKYKQNHVLILLNKVHYNFVMGNISFLVHHRMFSQVKKPTHFSWLVLLLFACGRSCKRLTRVQLSWAMEEQLFMHFEMFSSV